MSDHTKSKMLLCFIAAVMILLLQIACVAESKSLNSAVSTNLKNPYYFQDAKGKPMIFIGDYTWGTFSDVDFDYVKMFDSLKVRGLNVARV